MRIVYLFYFISKFFIGIGLVWWLGPLPDALAEERIAVFPVQIHAEESESYLQKGVQDVLESRLTAYTNQLVARYQADADGGNRFDPTTEGMETLRQTARQQGYTYLVWCSLTLIGKGGSLDVYLMKVAEDVHPISYFRKITGPDAILPATESIAREIGESISGVGISVSGHAVAGKKALPEKGRKGPTSWKSDRLPVQITGLCVGNIDGQGLPEIIAASNQGVHVFHHKGNTLVPIATYTGRSYHRFLSVDAADINQDKKQEIYLSCEHGGTGSIESQVLGWKDGKLYPILEDQPWMFRVIDTHSGPRLLGQKKGISIFFQKGAARLAWRSSLLQEIETVPLPEDMMVFGVSGPLGGAATGLMAGFVTKDRVCVLNPEAAVLWKSRESYGGRELFIKTIADHKKSAADRFYLPSRILAASNDAADYFVTVQNQSSSGRWFQKYRSYSSAKFVGFFWDGISLNVRAASSQVSGYVSDFLIADIDDDGRKELVYAVVLDQEDLFQKAGSYLVGQNLEPFLRIPAADD